MSFETIQQTLTEANGLDDAADDLIELALRAGGPDNVTCLIADVVAANGQAGLVTPQVVGAAAERATIRRVAPDTPAGRAAALGEPGAVDEEDDLGKGADGDNGAKRAVSSSPRPGAGHPWLRRALLAGFVVAVVCAVSWGGYSWSQRQYYIGPSEGRVAIFRGLSQPVAGIHLSNVYERPDVALSDLPSYDRTEVEQTIEANNLDHARKIVQDLQSDAADCRAGATPSGGGAPTSAPPGTAPAGGSTPRATGSPATPGTTPLAGATASSTPSVLPTGTATGTQAPSPPRPRPAASPADVNHRRSDQAVTLQHRPHRRGVASKPRCFVFAIVLAMAAYAAVGLGVDGELPPDLLTYGAGLGALAVLVAHLVVRRVAPLCRPAPAACGNRPERAWARAHLPTRPQRG